MLYVIEEYSHESIAEELIISKGTSKSQLFKTKKMLRRLLAVENYNDEKIEKNIKDKLEKRRIEPSNRVWASIDKQLDRSKTRRFKKKYFMYGIAAGILIILSFLGRGQLKINSDPKLDAPKQAAPSSLDQPVDQTIREIQLSVNELAKRKRTKHFSFKIQYDQLKKIPIDR